MEGFLNSSNQSNKAVTLVDSNIFENKQDHHILMPHKSELIRKLYFQTIMTNRSSRTLNI